MLTGILSAQNGILSGQLKDKITHETIIGATVTIEGTSLGAITDFDGNFTLSNVPSGSHNIVVSYVGYKKIKKEITIVPAQKQNVEFELEEESTVLADVVVVGKVNKQNAIALATLQQKSPGMITGISNDDIKKSPDKSTSDVLKRVSGASIVDQKFVIIRGLSDRYNNALLNGSQLPSTEPDKRSFSFDLFPSSVLSNLVIYKTATPDLPGEFAGGVVQVNTKEVSEEPFMELSAGMGMNSMSTFKAYRFYEGGNTDVLGYDSSVRTLDPKVTKEGLANNDTKYAVSKYVRNDWAVKDFQSMMPSSSLQLSGGRNMNMFGKKLGVIGALTIQNTNKYSELRRADYNIDKTQVYDYFDNQYKKVYNHGGMFNATYNLSPKSKISMNNLASILGDDQFIERNGYDLEQQRSIKAYSMLYTSTFNLNNQLTGEHEISSGGSTFKWSVSQSIVNRKTPSYRRMTYIKNDDQSAADPFIAYVPIGAPSPNYAGRFYSDQSEKFYTSRFDLSIPMNASGSSIMKFGLSGDYRDRLFDARVFGYTYASRNVPLELLTLGIGEIFAPENINPSGFVLKESTNPNDSYKATGLGTAAYAMVDHPILADKLRLIAGLRVERFQQKLNSFAYGGKEIKIDEVDFDYLPSLNLVYSLEERTNVRLSASRTVIRPNFREIAPFSFYDFNLSAAIVGNPDLKRTQVTNLDLKFEKFLNSGQQISLSTFYKKFKNPVEQIYETLGAGTKNFNYQNAGSAENYGVEAEVRYDLSGLTSSLSGFQIRANVAWIHSKVDLSAFAGQNAAQRPLQSQSPYVLNLAVSYQPLNSGFSASLLYNRIGRRLWLVGSNGYLDTYEAPRNLLDFQITQKIGNAIQLKFSASDILNEYFRYYQDQNRSGSYESDDTIITENKTGSNFSFGISFMLK